MRKLFAVIIIILSTILLSCNKDWTCTHTITVLGKPHTGQNYSDTIYHYLDGRTSTNTIHLIETLSTNKTDSGWNGITYRKLKCKRD